MPRSEMYDTSEYVIARSRSARELLPRRRITSPWPADPSSRIIPIDALSCHYLRRLCHGSYLFRRSGTRRPDSARQPFPDPTCDFRYAYRACSRSTPDTWREAQLVRNTRQLTFAGRRAGEGYFSPDGSQLIFQSEREPDNPFFQIYVMNRLTGQTRRVSPGIGKTTCAWFHPSQEKVLFASTHEDPDAEKKQQAELEERRAGTQRRYEWDFDEQYDLFEANARRTASMQKLTEAKGYDAEGSWSPDGEFIAFASNRHAYAATLSAEEKERFQQDPSSQMDIYIMRADGSDVRRLTTSLGYDGGPFFSPDGKRLVWRRFSPDGVQAEVWTMRIDGTDQKQVTRAGGHVLGAVFSSVR